MASFGVADASEVAPIAPTAKPATALPAPPAPLRRTEWRQTLDLQHWATANFHRDFNGIVAGLSAAHATDRAGRLLDAAELYLTHMLLSEAASTLKGTTPETAAQIRRHRALSDATDLLAGRPVTDFSNSPLGAPERPDGDFWASLQAITADDTRALRKNLAGGFTGMGQQSRAVLRAMLPAFTEAAIETGHKNYADAALMLMQELPDLANAPVGHFLQGRAQEKRRNESSALDAYFRAAKGWDQYAARARIAVADMSLRNGAQGALLAAQSTLTEGAEAWRGGEYEIQILNRLARIHAKTGNEVEGLLTLGKIVTRFPNSPEADTAQAQAQTLLAKVYTKGAQGAYTLADWMDVHLRLLPFFRYTPAFPNHTETLGDYLLALGATDLAAQEYRRAIRLLQEREDSALSAAAPDLFRLNLSLAAAQKRAGLADDAQITLEVMSAALSAEQAEEHAALYAAVLSDLGDRAGLINTNLSSPSARHLRDLGRALSEDEKWVQVVDVMRQYWLTFPQEFSVEDATRLLIAANRSGDVETRDRVVNAFPGLTQSEPLVALATSLNEVAPVLLPLRADTAAARLDKLKSAFESIKNTGISP